LRSFLYELLVEVRNLAAAATCSRDKEWFGCGTNKRERKKERERERVSSISVGIVCCINGNLP